MLQVLVNISESAYQEICKNGITNVDYDIKQMMRDGMVICGNLCDSWIKTENHNPCIDHFKMEQEFYNYCPYCGKKLKVEEVE